MCHNRITVHRCEHRTPSIDYCRNAFKNPVTRRQNMCDHRSKTVTDQAQSLCGRKSCELTKKCGVWICSTCEFGDEEDGRNRYQRCSACSHEICSDCKAWK